MPVLDAPVKLTLSVTERCNLGCVYCYGDCNRRPHDDELSTAEWIRVVDELADAGVVMAFVEGGEPLLRDDIFTLLGHASLRMLTWLRTNGTLVDAAMAERIAAAGVGTVCVDIHGATAETHEAITGVAGSFAATSDGIRHLVAAGVPVIATLVLNRTNVGELQAWLDCAGALGCVRAGVLRLYPIGRAKRRWRALALGVEETMAAIGALRVPDGLSLMQSWHPNDGNCCWQNGAVLARGESVGCPYLRELVRYGNVREVSYLETWQHPLYRLLRAGRVDSHCPDCASSQGSKGGCRATAYAFHGRWGAPDPFCAHTNEGVDLRELPDWMLDESAGPPRPPGG